MSEAEAMAEAERRYPNSTPSMDEARRVYFVEGALWAANEAATKS